MKIKMDSLVITEYCSTDRRKFRFIKDMSEDPLIHYFVSNTMDEWLEDSEGLDELLVGPAYIIEDKRKLVGLIRMASIDSNGTLNLHYAVHPDYRKQGYGSKILSEVKKYVFKSIPAVNKIELYIKEINNGSIKCAVNAGYQYERDVTPVRNNEVIRIYALKK